MTRNDNLIIRKKRMMFVEIMNDYFDYYCTYYMHNLIVDHEVDIFDAVTGQVQYSQMCQLR